MVFFPQLVSPTLYEKHQQKSLKEAQVTAKNSFHCKTPDCQGWCFITDNINSFKCPICKRLNCITCQVCINFTMWNEIIFKIFNNLKSIFCVSVWRIYILYYYFLFINRQFTKAKIVNNTKNRFWMNHKMKIPRKPKIGLK